MRYCTFQKCKFIYSINLTINRIVQDFQFLDISFYIDMCISKPEIEILFYGRHIKCRAT